MLALTVGQGLKLVGAGVVAGVVGAAAVTRVIGSLLYDVTPTDPISFAAVIVVLGAVGLLASYLPRAARCASILSPPCGASRSRRADGYSVPMLSTRRVVQRLYRIEVLVAALLLVWCVAGNGSGLAAAQEPEEHDVLKAFDEWET